MLIGQCETTTLRKKITRIAGMITGSLPLNSSLLLCRWPRWTPIKEALLYFFFGGEGCHVFKRAFVSCCAPNSKEEATAQLKSQLRAPNDQLNYCTKRPISNVNNSGPTFVGFW